MKKQKLKFPDGFLWGAATSAHQVEGGNLHNDWADAEKTGRVPKAGLACDHYHRYAEDFKIAKSLGHNAHRLSIEWSRIEPRRGEFDEKEIHHYHEVLSYLKKHGFTTFVTLHHFTNPLWFAREGGWLANCAPKHFAEYTAKICQTLGHLVDFWITVNEPLLYAGATHAISMWPPFKKSYWQAWKVYKNLLAAHERAYDVIHNYYTQARVGFAQNISFNQGGLAAKINDYLEIDFPYKKTRNDFLALNHYFYRKFRWGFKIKHGGESTDWPIFKIYPKAIYHVLMKLKKYGKPIYVTENGIPDAKDRKRELYINAYLLEINNAIARGADVRGYLHWSLLDNYEWAEGYKYRFGLVAVDFKTQKRTIHESAYAYRHICEDNALTVRAPLDPDKNSK